MFGIINLIPTLIVLGILIFIHEFGHFIVAKTSGVTVEKFSIGFGPEIFKFSYKGTIYAISLIPIGGFVKMAGETIEDRKDSELQPNDFLAQGIFKRFSIVFSGPLMNYILAFFLFVILFQIGKPAVKPIVGKLVDGYPAQEAGIMIDDNIIAINGQPINTWTELHTIISQAESDTIDLLVLRENKKNTVTIKPIVDTEQNVFGDDIRVKKIGIYPSDKTVLIKYGFFESIKQSAQVTYYFTKISYQAIYRLIIGKLNLKALSGPLRIIEVTSKTAQLGIVHLINLTALLSISLAIFNLLPIPALDGGHILFIFFEAILRRPIPFKIQERFSQVGFALLMVLMALVTWNDAINSEFFDKVKQAIPFLR